jgi:putative two-component system response regulator
MDGKDKILIVDDEPANIFLLELILEDKYELIKADNGKDTVRIAGEELPDLILLDIMMPVMDGLEVCKILSDNNKTRDIPIILVSAKIQDEDVEKGLDLGAVDYIKKPVSETELKARVRTATQDKTQGR